MSIAYKTVVHNPAVADGFGTVFSEAAEYFKGEGISIVGEGFKSILHEGALFEEYKMKMLGGVSADNQEVLGSLMENAKMAMLESASISGIDNIQSLTLPVIRKFWPRVAFKEVVPTTPVKLPAFTLSFMQPYLMTMDGTKYDLPKALRDQDIEDTIITRPKVETVLTLPVVNTNVATAAGVAHSSTDTLDNDFFVTSVVLAGDVGGVAETVTVPVRVKKELSDLIYAQVSGTLSDNVTIVTDTVFGKLNRAEMTLELASMGGHVVSVGVSGRLASDNKQHGDNVGFELRKKDIVIPTGEPIYASLPLEFIQDVSAVYGIDATLKSVELMTNTIAQKIDNELRNMLHDAQISNPAYESAWDAFPSQRFMGSPIEWYETLKKVIDFQATRILQDSGFAGGKFVLIGSPLDINLVQNVSWMFTNNTQVDGVNVQYSVGAYSATNQYVVVSSPNVKAGTMQLFYVSSDPDQITFQYFPYAFNVEKAGYLNPSNPNVPSIMMTRRQAYEVINPLIGKIVIHNNNGSMPL